MAVGQTMTRRRFLGRTVASAATAIGAGGLAGWLGRRVSAWAGESGRSSAVLSATRKTEPPRLVSKSLFVKAPGSKVAVWANCFYTRGEGLELMCQAADEYRSDTNENLRRRYSPDNGRTWSDWERIERYAVKTPQGMHRQYPGLGWIDPGTGRLLTMVLDGVLPHDDPLEGMTRWRLRYRVSVDGGRTSVVDEPVVQQGGYTEEHPFEGVWIGKNSMMIGASSCTPIRSAEGKILVPVCIAPLGPDGKYHRPGGGFTYHDAAVLIGTWTDGMKLSWEISERIVADPARSTRGADEPVLALMPDGRILMVIRGSNDVKPDLPGYKWYCISEDGGRHWTRMQPWTYADGSPFYSPASCSQLIMHSSGRCYWIGNIVPQNPRGNSPRYPLVIGEVDPKTLLLRKESVALIDTRGPDDHADLQLSNFFAYEDRENRQIVLTVTRFLSRGLAAWDGDSYLYRIAV